eukprot:gene5701-5940_t
MDFLQETVAKAPDLPPEGEADAPKPKRQRSRSFGKPGGREGSKRGPGSSSSPRPESPSHKQQQHQQKGPAAGNTGLAPAAAAAAEGFPQQGSEPAVGLPGVNAQLLATMARAQQEDNYDDDYDS